MGKVLLIEDDTDIRIALVRALSGRGHVVRSHGEAMSGIREVTEWPPDVVVLDLGLPDLHGSTALRMIRSVSSVPVIIAT
ncbi:MAG: response regulator, partial [Micromonosporaceae bacterium]